MRQRSDRANASMAAHAARREASSIAYAMRRYGPRPKALPGTTPMPRSSSSALDTSSSVRSSVPPGAVLPPRESADRPGHRLPAPQNARASRSDGAAPPASETPTTHACRPVPGSLSRISFRDMGRWEPRWLAKKAHSPLPSPFRHGRPRPEPTQRPIRLKSPGPRWQHRCEPPATHRHHPAGQNSPRSACRPGTAIESATDAATAGARRCGAGTRPTRSTTRRRHAQVGGRPPGRPIGHQSDRDRCAPVGAESSHPSCGLATRSRAHRHHACVAERQLG